MGGAHTWPVPVAAAGPVAVGTTLWRYEGQLSVTTIVKATFRLAAGEVMRVTAPEPLRVADEYVGGMPLCSLSAVRETVPQLQRAEVLLFGHAYAFRPPGSDDRVPTSETTVRLAVGSGETVWIDKTLRIVGDRDGTAPPAGFDRIPLRYERAIGGLGSVDNPIGVGMLGSAERSPNILYAADPISTVGGYGPIPPFFPLRERLRGKCTIEALHDEPAKVGSDFDWSYFQSAPADQRLDRLPGDGWLDLTGLSPKHDHLHSALPAAKALAEVFAGTDVNVPTSIPLQADMLIIEPDEHRCSMVWRGSFPVTSRAACSSLVIVAGLELPARPVRWPSSLEEAWALAAPSNQRLPTLASSTDDDRTVTRDRPVAGLGASGPSREQAPGSFRTALLDTSSSDDLQEAIQAAQNLRDAAAAATALDEERTAAFQRPEQPPSAAEPSREFDAEPSAAEPPDLDDDLETAVTEDDVATAVTGNMPSGAPMEHDEHQATAVWDNPAHEMSCDPEADIATVERQLAGVRGLEANEELPTRLIPSGPANDVDGLEAHEELPTRLVPSRTPTDPEGERG